MVLLSWEWGELEAADEVALNWMWRGEWIERESERMSWLWLCVMVLSGLSGEAGGDG
jgi:hypothetical protein